MSDAKPKKAAAKPKKPAAHPPYGDMICKAIVALREKNGSSRQAIKKYISETFKVDQATMNSRTRTAFKRLQKNNVVKTGSKSMNRFVLVDKPKAKKPKAKKPKAAAAKKPKSPKKPKAAKKPKTPKKPKAAAKKPAGEKKKAAKKPKAKKPKSPAKKAAPKKKPAAKKTPKKAAKK